MSIRYRPVINHKISLEFKVYIRHKSTVYLFSRIFLTFNDNNIVVGVELHIDSDRLKKIVIKFNIHIELNYFILRVLL